MGYGYLRRGDYLNAYGAYKAAAESYLGTVDEEPFCTNCKDNMAKIKDIQKNPDLNVGFERPARAFPFLPRRCQCVGTGEDKGTTTRNTGYVLNSK